MGGLHRSPAAAAPAALIALVASGGDLEKARDGALGGFMATLGLDVADLGPAWAVTAAGGTTAEITAAVSTIVGAAVAVATVAAIVA